MESVLEALLKLPRIAGLKALPKLAQVTVASEDEAVCHQIAELVQQDLDA